MTIESARWVTSSYSGSGGSCVEWAPSSALATGTVPVRDSKNPGGPVLHTSPASFAAFVAGVKAGEFRAV
ncbi:MULTISPECIES: DUF397 domain-containing protein [unclassified Streptomyces]|uniref:DUF397 domain-containing protein n=1 Tax=unclassified Streptomyces TaxID=2593676 RepID=UPI00081B1823|nr:MULTISPECIES: DUF397 domain-containing protein [unclassified Streptomyces]MEE1743254.1 DUF397 domain-containing protein [Streptomyces sp. JV184]MYQ83347.1 DUF397 domain-containing protein [Streptomyces sp. SID4936]SCD64764.1 protein of unknown function [Streptomyces sp. DvalAA-43]